MSFNLLIILLIFTLIFSLAFYFILTKATIKLYIKDRSLNNSKINRIKEKNFKNKKRK